MLQYVDIYDRPTNTLVIEKILLCEKTKIYRILQNHGSWEIDIAGSGSKRCLQGTHHYCKDLKHYFRCRVMENV